MCGHELDEARAKAAGLTSTYKGKTYYFCSYRCNKQFDKDPSATFSRKPGWDGGFQTPVVPGTAKDPVCGLPVATGRAKQAGRTSEYQGKLYYFDTDGCKQRFDDDPEYYLSGSPENALPHTFSEVPTNPDLLLRLRRESIRAIPEGKNLDLQEDQSLKSRMKPAAPQTPPSQSEEQPSVPSPNHSPGGGGTSMINRIIDFSVQNKVIVFIITAAACMMGWWSMQHLTLDAVPDLTDTQVIIYSRWDRSPDIMEDQVTYPIVTAMVGAPRVKSVRGVSDFGYSYVYVIFEDGTDIYWARSRTLEYLSGVLPRLPAGVKTEMGPDATGLGWVFQYALVDPTGKHSLEELRSYQDWYLRYYLKAVPGVAEVAPVGGFVRQYQVNVDPNRLQAYNLSISQVVKAVAGGNQEVGGRLIEFGGTEYMVRGRGYARSLQDFENIVLTASQDGTPIRVKDIGRVVMGPDLRRGVTDLDGTGEVVSGIIVMREGQNALDVIERVKAKIKAIEPGLPERRRDCAHL